MSGDGSTFSGRKTEVSVRIIRTWCGGGFNTDAFD